MKGRADWPAISDSLSAAPWGEIRRSVDPGSSLDEFFSSLVLRHVPKRTIRFRSRDKPWFDDNCRRVFESKQHFFNLWRRLRTPEAFDSFKAAQRRANSVYSAAEREYNSRVRETLNSSDSSHKWWSTLRESVFGTTSSIPPLYGANGSLVTDPGDKANLLLDSFQRKQSTSDISIPYTCHPEPSFKAVAFRSSEICRLIENLDSYGGTDPSGVFPLVFKKIAREIAKPLASVFRCILRSGSFPLCWRKAVVTAIPKGSPSPTVSDYRPISITPVLSKIYEKLIASRLGRFMESNGVIPRTQHAFRRGLGTCDALLHISHLIQTALDRGSEVPLVPLIESITGV